jgi:hypothetical protein
MSTTLGQYAVTYGDGTTQASAQVGYKNRIINGAMIIDQRNAGASTTPADGSYVADRFLYSGNISNRFIAGLNLNGVTPPVGFINYLGFQVASAYSITSVDYFNIQQRIEGYNISDLGWGTANAKTVSLSFWVYSSLTGTFGGSIVSGSVNRSYAFSYSIPSANTWTKITVTIPGDTGGTAANYSKVNGIGFILLISLAAGSASSGTAGSWSSTVYNSVTGAVSVVGTSSATFYITGVQLEVGSTATTFDVRDITTEIALCQRYYWQSAFFSAGFNGSGSIQFTGVQCPVAMRATPTIANPITATFVNFGIVIAYSTDQPSSITMYGLGLQFVLTGFGSTPSSGYGGFGSPLFFSAEL